MLWFDRRRSLGVLLAAAALPGCRMAPAYGPGGSASSLFDQIEIQEPQDPDEFRLMLYLEDKLGRAGAASPFTLSYSLDLDTENLGTDKAGTDQRVQVIGSATYALRRRGESGALASGTVRNFTGYSNTGNTVSTSAASQDATDRLLRILADDIAERLLLASPDLPL